MAFVDDDVAEMVLGVVTAQEGGIARFMDAERLVRGDMDACVLRLVAAVRRLAHDLGVGAEHVVETRVRLSAQFVAVHQKQRALELPAIRQPLQQADGNAGLACAGSQRQQRTRALVAGCDERGTLQHRADGRILVVARHVARGVVGGQQWCQRR